MAACATAFITRFLDCLSWTLTGGAGCFHNEKSLTLTNLAPSLTGGTGLHTLLASYRPGSLCLGELSQFINILYQILGRHQRALHKDSAATLLLRCSISALSSYRAGEAWVSTSVKPSWDSLEALLYPLTKFPGWRSLLFLHPLSKGGWKRTGPH